MEVNGHQEVLRTLDSSEFPGRRAAEDRWTRLALESRLWPGCGDTNLLSHQSGGRDRGIATSLMPACSTKSLSEKGQGRLEGRGVAGS